MRKFTTFEIACPGLKNGIHYFNYELDDVFFNAYGVQDFSESEINVKLKMDKKDSFFLLNFEITGKILTSCDRCGDPLRLELWDEFPLIVKRVADPVAMEEENEDPNIVFISQFETNLNVSKWIYDFALLSIPMQRIHPDDKAGKSTCNPQALKRLEEMRKNPEKGSSNPIWKELEKLKRL